MDQANILADMAEATRARLEMFRTRYEVEVAVVTVPSLHGAFTLREKAAELFSALRVGQDYGGRGLLMLLAGKEKQIRVEVGFELEGVFTDAFTGHVEDKQLKAYFLSGQLATGMVAVLEEIEARLRLLGESGDLGRDIAARDRRFLSGGGGADVDLTAYQSTDEASPELPYPAGRTPQEAWQTMVQSWKDGVRYPELGVYTPVTRLISRDFQNQPVSRLQENVRLWGDKDYEVLRQGDYAAIFFGNRKGWENAPFLFCRTSKGWQFDMVHQRKIVRMGASPHWGIERGDHPYMFLTARCPSWMGQDIPLEGPDIYHVSNDAALAGSILELEEAIRLNPNDFEAVMALGRLYVVCSMGQKRLDLLQQAKALDTGSPLPDKYLAIAHVDMHYQYETALKHLERYVDEVPEDPFGPAFLGRLYLELERFGDAVDVLEKTLVLAPDSVFAHCKLVRAYAGMSQAVLPVHPKWRSYRRAALDHLAAVRDLAGNSYWRISWLEKMLSQAGITETE